MSKDHGKKNTVEGSSVNRRDVIRSIGVGGLVGSSGIIGQARAESNTEDEIKREVTELTGSTKRQYIDKALSDSDVTKLSEYLSQDGYKPNISDSKVHRTEGADKDSDLEFSVYHVVLILLENDELQRETASAAILWTDKSLKSEGVSTPLGMRVPEENATSSSPSAQTEIDSNPDTGFEYTIQDGEVNEESKPLTSDSPNFQISSNDCYCQVPVVECEKIPWYCWVGIATSYVGVYGACAGCSVGAFVACGYCLVAIAGSGASTYGCVAENNCWNTTTCVTEEVVQDNPCWCEEVYHPNC